MAPETGTKPESAPAHLVTRLSALRYTRWGSIVLSWDFLVSVPLAAGLGAGIGLSESMAKGASGAFLACVGVLVALAAVVIAAHTLLTTLLDPAYVEVLKATDGGIKGVSRPYKIVQVVCGAGAMYALGMAFSWPVIEGTAGWVRALAAAPVVFLTGWGVFGSVQLVSLGAFHLESRVSVLNIVREARRLRDERSRSA